MSKSTEVILTLLGCAVFGALFGLILIEWAAGCGETYVAADGKRYANECVFIK